MVFTSIPAGDVDAESPIDDNLMGLIKENFDDHESRILVTKTYPLEWRANGYLNQLVPVGNTKYKRIDGARQLIAQSFTQLNMVLEYPPTSGTLEIDIRKYRPLNHKILSIASQYTGSINSISQVAPALATQSITRSTAQISTQSITLFKAAINISSIIYLGSNLWRYNLASAPDSDWKVSATVTFASCSNAANDGSFLIVRVNDDGGNNLVITNPSGVAQTGAAGTATYRAYSYNFTNPVSTQFGQGDVLTAASHSSGSSDGPKTIYTINSGGNNIIVYDPTGVVQGGVAGNVNVNRWIFAFSSAASATDFIVGEFALTTGHTSGANNGSFYIHAVNSGGNNIIVYNGAGVAQGGVAGTVNTNRWVFALSVDPTGSVVAGDSVVSNGATNPNNVFGFVAKEINRSGSNNIVVVNPVGVAQGGAAGTMSHQNAVFTLDADYSTIYNTRSNIEIYGVVSSGNVSYFFDVVQVNRGGGSNYNVVVLYGDALSQASPAGRIVTESKSIFSTRPKMVFPLTGENTYNNAIMQRQTTEAVFDGTDGSISGAEVTANVMVGLDVVTLPTGDAQNLTVQLA